MPASRKKKEKDLFAGQMPKTVAKQEKKEELAYLRKRLKLVKKKEFV